MKKRNRRIELVGKTRVIRLKHGYTFMLKPGFLVIKRRNNTYVVTFINDHSVRFYQGTAGGIIQTNIGLNDFSRRFNIAENFILEIIPKMRERIWEWCSRDAVLDESMAFAIEASKKYRAEELCEDIEYLILDSLGDKSAYTWFVRKSPGVYEHRTIPEMIAPDLAAPDYFCEGFVVLTKSRLKKLREAEARLHAAAAAAADADADADCELAIDINYGGFFKEEPSEGFRYKHPESFADSEFRNVPRWIKPVEKLPPHWWRETRDDDTEE